MALLPKPYHFLTELVERWGVSLQDMACYGQEGLIELCIMALALPVQRGFQPPGENGRPGEPVLADSAHLNGPQPLRAQDVWDVIRRGTSRIHGLRATDPLQFVQLLDEAGLEVTTADLLVRDAERQRFETAYGLGSSAADFAGAEPAAPFTHSPDFTLVMLAGAAFALGPRQAAVVRMLHEAHRGGNPWVLGSELLTGAGVKSVRLVDIFKSKPNWRDLIRSDQHGRWRLNLPEPAARRMRAFRKPHLRLVS